MTSPSAAPKVASLADLFAIAYRIEADAVERYELLTRQMETFNNPELAAVFRDLGRAEKIHRDEIQRLAGDPHIEARAQRVEWKRGDSPEEMDLGALHYLMTPWQALQLALAGEKRALEFFQHVSKTVSNAQIKKVADEFVEEEAEHVELVHRLLRKYPRPAGSWDYDPDPPAPQD